MRIEWKDSKSYNIILISNHAKLPKKCQFHWISSHSFNRFGPFQARSELQQENRTGSWDRVWGAGIFYCNSWNTLDNCPIEIPSLEGIISYSQASIARRKPGRRYLKSAFIRDIQLMNDSPVFWSRHSPGSWRIGERVDNSPKFFLYLNLFCTCKDDMNILQSIVVLSSINVIFASTLCTVD